MGLRFRDGANGLGLSGRGDGANRLVPVTKSLVFAGWGSDFLDNSSSPKFGHSVKIVRQKEGHILRRAVVPLGGVLNDTSGQFRLRLEERQTKLPRNKVREGASLEEQARST